ncbi:MAG TPA: hypothetical protein PKM64_04995, partial [Thermoanaerobaculia bacterium]|nr:hypothetical protein [Thermoanaerobaculia bacterium]
MGLRLRFILAISTLLALVLAGNAYVFVIETARSLRAEIEARAVAFGTLAVEPLATAYDAYAASGRPKLGEVARRLHALAPEVAEMRLYDVTGNVGFDLREFAVPELFPLARAPATGELLAQIRGFEIVSGPTEGVGGQQRFRVVVPYVEEWGR